MNGHDGRTEHCYDDMLDLPHPTSGKHPRMPLRDRAAQFSAFAALTGLDEAMDETARREIERVEEDGHY